MSTTHSPGPLTTKGPSSGKVRGVDDGGDYAIVNSADEIIGEAIYRTGRTTTAPAESNARLWAAAPELLACTKQIIDWLERTGEDRSILGKVYAYVTDAKLVIAKAEGRKP